MGALMDCLFCRIVAGEIPSEQVAQNDAAFAFLDIMPLRKGHVLVIPKRHAARAADVSADEWASMMTLAQDVMARQTKTFGTTGTTLAINDGAAAGQEVMHVHLHLVPRVDGDGVGPVHALFSKRPKLEEGELSSMADALRG